MDLLLALLMVVGAILVIGVAVVVFVAVVVAAGVSAFLIWVGVPDLLAIIIGVCFGIGAVSAMAES